MRPKSILMFERIFLASLVVMLVNSLISWDDMNAALADDPQLTSAGYGSGVLVASIALGLLVPLLLWYFIAHRASRIAKWLLVVLTVANIAVFVDQVGSAPGGIPMMLSTAGLVLQVIALWYLFKADAKAWLAGDDTPAEVTEGPGDPL